MSSSPLYGRPSVGSEFCKCSPPRAVNEIHTVVVIELVLRGDCVYIRLTSVLMVIEGITLDDKDTYVNGAGDQQEPSTADVHFYQQIW